ncbi:hypothetical protein TCON_2628, partial [Astathelohania contejeani]
MMNICSLHIFYSFFAFSSNLNLNTQDFVNNFSIDDKKLYISKFQEKSSTYNDTCKQVLSDISSSYRIHITGATYNSYIDYKKKQKFSEYLKYISEMIADKNYYISTEQIFNSIMKNIDLFLFIDEEDDYVKENIKKPLLEILKTLSLHYTIFSDYSISLNFRLQKIFSIKMQSVYNNPWFKILIQGKVDYMKDFEISHYKKNELFINILTFILGKSKFIDDYLNNFSIFLIQNYLISLLLVDLDEVVILSAMSSVSKLFCFIQRRMNNIEISPNLSIKNNIATNIIKNILNGSFDLEIYVKFINSISKILCKNDYDYTDISNIIIFYLKNEELRPMVTKMLLADKCSFLKYYINLLLFGLEFNDDTLKDDAPLKIYNFSESIENEEFNKHVYLLLDILENLSKRIEDVECFNALNFFLRSLIEKICILTNSLVNESNVQKRINRINILIEVAINFVKREFSNYTNITGSIADLISTYYFTNEGIFLFNSESENNYIERRIPLVIEFSDFFFAFDVDPSRCYIMKIHKMYMILLSIVFIENPIFHINEGTEDIIDCYSKVMALKLMLKDYLKKNNLFIANEFSSDFDEETINRLSNNPNLYDISEECINSHRNDANEYNITLDEYYNNYDNN